MILLPDITNQWRSAADSGTACALPRHGTSLVLENSIECSLGVEVLRYDLLSHKSQTVSA